MAVLLVGMYDRLIINRVPEIGGNCSPLCYCSCAESMGIIQYTQVSTFLYASIRTRVSVIRRVWYQSQTVPYNGISDCCAACMSLSTR